MLVTSEFLAAWQKTLFLDLRSLAPELVLAATVVLLLLARMSRRLATVHLGGLALGGTLAGLMTLLAPSLGLWPVFAGGPAFSSLLILDPAADYLRLLLLGFAVLLVILTRLTGTPNTEDAADFYTLILGSTLGLMLMVSASHLVLLFLALEMASLPSYVLSGFAKTRSSSEAALKYVLFGAASAGVALYGISLLVLNFGTGHLDDIAIQSARMVTLGGKLPTSVLAGWVMLLVAIGFKLAAVPFHFWLPDVFTGASAEIGAYLSVASKIAAVGLLARLLITLQTHMQFFDAVYWIKQFGLPLVLIAILTMSLGNLAALAQTNLKRLLAYSTIAHAGYMLLALVTFRLGSLVAVDFYLTAYLLMNLGAFAVVALLQKAIGSVELADCRGLLYRSPTLAICFGVFLLSLLGLPPLAGFVGKFLLFSTVYQTAQDLGQNGQSGLATIYYVGLGFALLNTLLSAGYYLRILKLIGLDDAPENAPPVTLPAGSLVYLLVLAVGLLVLGIWWEPLSQYLATTLRMPA